MNWILKKILGYSAYSTVGVDQKISVTVDSREREKGQKGFVPEAFRWAVDKAAS